MTRIRDAWVGKVETRRVFDALADGGHQVYFVGGCVRDALLGRAVGDIDLATEARPGQVMDLARAAGLKPIPTGYDHGTITVVSGGLAHEVTTFRRDVESDGRRAVVAFTDQMDADARRRDFTMNALYADREGRVIDPLGGLPDLRGRQVRFIGDAEARIREDYLRILRFFRFLAWYGQPQTGPDAEGLAACAKLSDGLDSLSRERIGAEMLRLLAAPDPAPAVAALAASGGLLQVLPGADATGLAPLVFLEAETGTAPAAVRRLAVLGGEDAAGRLRLSNRESRRLDLIRSLVAEPRDPAHLAYRHGADTALDIALVRAALSGQQVPEGLQRDIDAGASAVFPVRAADLAGEYAGPALGEKLRSLETRWLRSGFALTRAELLQTTGA